MTTTAAPELADASLLQLYSEYAGIPLPLLVECVRNFGSFNQVAWAECEGGDWAAKAKVFYEQSHEYLFDLLAGSPSKAHRREVLERYGHWPWLLAAGTDALEFGGGLGVTCSLMCDAGKRVTYVDVDGPAAKFARWYFAQLGQRHVEIALTPSDRTVLPAGRQWDLVYSESVIEHVPEPTATVEALARAVRPGGLLYLIIDAHEVSPSFPMHRHVHLEELLAGAPSLRAMQHVLHDGDGRNAFRRPAAAP